MDGGRNAPKDSPTRKKSSIPIPDGRADDGLTRTRSSKSTKSTKSANMVPYRSPQPQSLNAALEKLALASAPPSPNRRKDNGDRLDVGSEERGGRHSTSLGRASGREMMSGKPRLSMDPSRVAQAGRGGAPATPSTPSKASSTPGLSPTSSFDSKLRTPTSPTRTLPQGPQLTSGESNLGTNKQWMAGMTGKEISEPVFDLEATKNMSPVKMRNAGRPILVELPPKDHDSPWDAELGIYTHRKKASLNTG